MTEPSERDRERARAWLRQDRLFWTFGGDAVENLAEQFSAARDEALREAAGVAECGVKCCERPTVRNIIKLDVLGEPVVTGQEQECCGCPEPLEPHEIAAAIRALTGGGNG